MKIQFSPRSLGTLERKLKRKEVLLNRSSLYRLSQVVKRATEAAPSLLSKKGKFAKKLRR